MVSNKYKLSSPVDRHALISLNLAVLLFGLAGLFAKFTAVSPLTIALGRSAIAAVTLLIVLILYRENPVPSLRGKWILLLFSGCILAVHWYTFFRSIQTSTVAVGLVTFSAFPVFVTIIEPISSRERIRGLELFTSGLVLAGVLLIVPRFDWSDQILRGECWGLLSGFAFALLAITNRHLVRAVSPLPLACVQNAVCALALFTLAARYCRWPGTHDLVLLLILGTVCTALSHCLFIASLRKVRAQTASIVAGLESVYGIVFAVLTLGEIPTTRTILGGTVILAAASIAMFQHRSRG
jgi:drug/metabolite transporter (DMT)-like permease